MISFMSSWAGGIVIAIVVATIIEMILPNTNNKKYIKTVIGVYILFTIIAPIIQVFAGKDLNLENILSSTIANAEYQTKDQNINIDTNHTIEQLYKENLEKDILSKLNAKGYTCLITAISINFIEGKNYGEINQVTIKITGTMEETTVKSVEKINITIGDQSKMKESNISDEEANKLQEYISSEYKIKKEQVNIN